MRCACFSLANSGACSPSSISQTHRNHSEGMMSFGPESTAQRKPSRVDTSIAFSRPPSESRNASSFSISRLVSGPDLIGPRRNRSREAMAEGIVIMAGNGISATWKSLGFLSVSKFWARTAIHPSRELLDYCFWLLDDEDLEPRIKKLVLRDPVGVPSSCCTMASERIGH